MLTNFYRSSRQTEALTVGTNDVSKNVEDKLSAPNPLSKHPPNNNCPSEIPQEVILSSLCRLDKQKGQIHTYYTCKEKDCYSLSDPSGGTFNKASTAAEVILTNFGTDGCSKDLKTMMSMSLLLEFGGWPSKKMLPRMFCFLCRFYDTCTKRNKDYTWNTKPCVRMITQAIQLYFNSDMHRSAIEKEHLKQTSPFQKEHELRKQCENEVLNKVFMSIYWLAKEEISNTKLLSLLNLMEQAGLQNLKHFTYTGKGTLQEMFLILGQVVKDRVTERASKSKFFGCLVDEVTDVYVLQQFVTFVKYVYEGKSRTQFLHTEHLSEVKGKALAGSLEGILEKCSLDISM